MKRFEELKHTADIKIRVYGTTKKDLFLNALYGMFMMTQPHIPPMCKKAGNHITCDDLPQERAFEVSAPDQESLLVDFLSEALYLSDMYNEVYLDAQLNSFEDTHIGGVLKGVSITGFNTSEIKAVTYHDLHIVTLNHHWQTDIVFDI